MRKYIVFLLSILIAFSFISCTKEKNKNQNSFVDIYKNKATEFIENGDTESAIKALEEGITATNDKELQIMLNELKNNSSPEKENDSSNDSNKDTLMTNSQNSTTQNIENLFEISKYEGEWATDNFSWDKGGFHIVISAEDSIINIACSHISSTREADTTVIGSASMIINNTFTTGFDDSWGNSGLMKLKFENKKIICTISDMKFSNEGSGWSLGEGEYILKPYTEVQTTYAEGKYDDVIGSYIDAYGAGDYQIHIEYKDKTKNEAFVKIDFPNNRYYEVPISGREDFNITGTLMSGGSEPTCAVDLTITNSGWIEAGIYFSETDEYETIIFMPIEELS